jgi:capsular polysaccharide biosynthesis protein
LQDDLFDLGGLIKTFLRNWWILALGVLIGGFVAAWTFESKLPIYSSTAKLFVQGGADAGGVSARDIDESRRISQLYGDLATTRPILDAVADREDIPFSGSELTGKIGVRESRSFIEISVRDADPALAALLANATGLTLISELANRQIAQIAQFQDSLTQLGLEDDAEIVAAQAANLPVLSFAEQAVPAASPISTSGARIQRVIFGVMVGVMAASGLVIARSVLDDTVKTEEDLAAATGLSTLGAIPDYPRNGSHADLDERQRARKSRGGGLLHYSGQHGLFDLRGKPTKIGADYRSRTRGGQEHSGFKSGCRLCP